jgi:hypothetical protein
MRKQQREIILDDSDLIDFVEKASAEDRVSGIIEPHRINFKKLAEEWMVQKKLNKEAPVESIVVLAEKKGDKLELSLQKHVPAAPISVSANEIKVGNLCITVVPK